MNKVYRIMGLSVLCLALLMSSFAVSPVAAGPEDDEGSVYDYAINSAVETGAGEVTVNVQARYCPGCNPNPSQAPGCPAFHQTYSPGHHSCTLGYPSGTFIAVRVKGGGGAVLAAQKLVLHPGNMTLNVVNNWNFVFTGLPVSAGDTLTVEADTYCSWCGHWFPVPKSVTISASNSQVTYTGDTSGFAGTIATASATLIDSGTGAPLVGEVITFTLDGLPPLSAVTDGSGSASTPYPIPPTMAGGIYPMTARFAGNISYFPHSDTVDFTVITNRPPKAEANGPYVTTENFPIQFQAFGSSDPDGDPLQFRWDFDSDGTWDTPWTSAWAVPNMWCDDFTGTATLEVSDGQATATDTAAVTVANLAPIIDVLSYAPTDVQCANEPITFTGIGKDPGCDSVTVEWNYGDGNSYVDASQTGPPFNSVVTHTYGAFGTYNVTLTVTDDDGGKTKGSLTVVVKDTTAPEVTGECIESVNPHGNIIPGKNRGKNGKPKGVNPDGFYELAFEVTDNCDPNPQLFVGTADNPLMFVVEPGIVVKFTESVDAEPVMKKIGSNNGKADAVTWHIILPGDPVISAVDASGNIVTCCECLVPPPPK
ncbi:PKD domain-containing protein [Bacteroidota bacterium]